MLLWWAACRGVDAAPADVDSLLHALWADFDGATDEELAATLAQVAEVVGPVSEVTDGSVSALSVDEVSAVGRVGVDPALAVGVMMQGPVACALGPFEDIVEYADQDELYPVYDSYERSYLSDLGAWQTGESDRLDWDVVFRATVLFVSYDAHLLGGLRRLPMTEGQRGILARTWMDRPAEFDGNQTWTQDYQVEAFWPQQDGTLGHLYGLWRDVDYGAMSMQDEDIQRIMLNSLADWDADTSKLCADGLP
jgi:hypothetical protein